MNALKETYRNRNQAGMSLLEMIVVSAILSTFSLFIGSLIMVTQDAVAIQSTGTPVRTEAKQTMEYIAKELREADLSAATRLLLPPNGIDIDPNNQITFYKPDQIDDAGIQSRRCVQFYLNTGGITTEEQQRVYRIESSNQNCAGTPELIGRNVSSLQFAFNNGVVTTNITTTKTSQETAATMQSTLTSQFKLRNGG